MVFKEVGPEVSIQTSSGPGTEPMDRFSTTYSLTHKGPKNFTVKSPRSKGPNDKRTTGYSSNLNAYIPYVKELDFLDNPGFLLACGDPVSTARADYKPSRRPNGEEELPGEIEHHGSGFTRNIVGFAVAAIV